LFVEEMKIVYRDERKQRRTGPHCSPRAMTDAAQIPVRRPAPATATFRAG
jgi:hypothetical protein